LGSTKAERPCLACRLEFWQHCPSESLGQTSLPTWLSFSLQTRDQESSVLIFWLSVILCSYRNLKGLKVIVNLAGDFMETLHWTYPFLFLHCSKAKQKCIYNACACIRR
jgi:hypothetical protein